LTLVSDEAMLPYCRPALSKQYLVGTQVPDWLLYRPESFYANHDIRCVLGDRAVAIDRSSKHVSTASGQRLRYDGLALATGSRARRLGVPGDDKVCYVRTVADSQYLRDRLPGASRVVVIGGGSSGSKWRRSLYRPAAPSRCWPPAKLCCHGAASTGCPPS